MKEIDFLEVINILITIGVVFILLGTTIELEKLIKDNTEKQEIIERQATELIICKSENENLEKRYEKQDK